ncbi:hypothetical protein F2Q70_00033666 [Brassica cretica]|uniref:Amino acid transporter transmembrane domain-containing protein n=1 Tax=Brassica cretica TaxID=69181 RepID=A0A8S9JSS1_BRACR|nr:hypothetical protein F2Q68_00028526 [Brassica cretica]KAF2584748.1 hypothetical protein F2Q70_00033666 [Brassica cretica]
MALNISSEVFREVAEKGFFLDSSCLLPSILFIPPYTHRVATSLRMAKFRFRYIFPGEKSFCFQSTTESLIPSSSSQTQLLATPPLIPLKCHLRGRTRLFTPSVQRVQDLRQRLHCCRQSQRGSRSSLRLQAHRMAHGRPPSPFRLRSYPSLHDAPRSYPRSALLLGLNSIKTLTHLAPLSIFADVVDLAAMAVVIVEDSMIILKQRPDVVAFGGFSLFFYGMGVAVYSFEGVGMVLPLESEMKDKDKFGKVLALGMGFIYT